MLTFFFLFPALLHIEAGVGREVTHANYISQASWPMGSGNVQPVECTGRRLKVKRKGKARILSPVPALGSISSINESHLQSEFPLGALSSKFSAPTVPKLS